MLDAYKVQSYMGHQHYSTTQRYLHHKPQPEDARALERAFGGGAGEQARATSARNTARTEVDRGELSETERT